MRKITRFIKYHNGFNMILTLVFIAGVSAFAAGPDLKNDVIGKKVVEEQGIDNSALLSTSLDDFDFQMKIANVEEDEGNYYIDYQFQTLSIVDNVWQIKELKKRLTISKSELKGKDLGLYAQEELSEVIDQELFYLKRVQEKEKEKGRSFVLQTTKWTGLIGLVLNPQTKTLSGYEPVVKRPEPSKPLPSSKPSILAPSQSCIPLWNCGDWTPFSSDVVLGRKFVQKRVCIDKNNCSLVVNKPKEEREAVGTYTVENNENPIDEKQMEREEVEDKKETDKTSQTLQAGDNLENSTDEDGNKNNEDKQDKQTKAEEDKDKGEQGDAQQPGIKHEADNTDSDIDYYKDARQPAPNPESESESESSYESEHEMGTRM